MSPHIMGKRRRNTDNRKTYKLHKSSPVELKEITENEREFFWKWSIERHLEEAYTLLALTYWMRVKSKLGTFFLIHKKEFYMVLCLHLSLKWLCYDEAYKCCFITDLKMVGDVSRDNHQEMELQILEGLGWEL